MELNREQTIKALECCASEEYICTQCPIDEKIKDDCECGKVVARNALSLIKELTEEIDQRIEDYSESQKKWEKAYDELELENERLTDLVKELQEYNEAWVKDNHELRKKLLEENK